MSWNNEELQKAFESIEGFNEFQTALIATGCLYLEVSDYPLRDDNNLNGFPFTPDWKTFMGNYDDAIREEYNKLGEIPEHTQVSVEAIFKNGILVDCKFTLFH